MKYYARKGYPEPLPGVMVCGPRLAELIIAVERLGLHELEISYLSVDNDGKGGIKTVIYGRGDFPFSRGAVITLG
jgi:hypothetical protein